MLSIQFTTQSSGQKDETKLYKSKIMGKIFLEIWQISREVVDIGSSYL